MIDAEDGRRFRSGVSGVADSSKVRCCPCASSRAILPSSMNELIRFCRFVEMDA